jgi:4-hydroxy-3-polyprenylbenzoate decarboxylase
MSWILITSYTGGGEVDLREYVGKPETKKGLSTDFEVAKELFKNPEKTLYFSEVKDYKFDIVGNIITGREDIYNALGTNKENYIKDVLSFFENPIEPKVKKGGLCQEEECSLYDLPFLNHFEGDGGRYITSGIVIATDPEFGRNASIHRLLLHENNQLGIRIVPRHLFEYFKRAEERGEDLEVAIAIGVSPAIFFAASFSPPIEYDEFSLAGGITKRPLQMTRCLSVDAEAPSQSEFVIEGKILTEKRAPEGPFADVTGTYDRIRDQPIIEVTKVTHRKGAIYQALLPTSIEHRLFMGMPREPRIFNLVSEVSEVANVCLSDGGKNWLQGVVSLKKKRGEIKDVIDKAFSAHPSMKHVIIVDDDINIFDPDEVEFAISTRFQADKDVYVLKNMPGSTLDPSTDEDGMTTKVGIDATKPIGRESDYEFARIP